ncbi:MAG: low specificity L-threonine aldolase [Lachnospiraceae bacterium]|nr:low specificity L-threonine aldolase [Lachnospiraceae bacterium]
MDRPSFESDYTKGTHPLILEALQKANLVHSAGYGLDEFSEAAREKIRIACDAPDADVFFLAGGTQSNAVMIDALLKSWQGVVAASSGHINTHEAGAVEFCGHKVLTLPEHFGKIYADELETFIRDFFADENFEHMVMPGAVYISQPTEYGTLYSLDELTAISEVCREAGIPLYMDGARLAYALACPANDVTLPDIAALCDAFYIGGTKCGALFGEAVVIPQHGLVPHLLTQVKQHGALLAKGFIAGIQFDTLFTDDLYLKLGQTAMNAADRIRAALIRKGYELAFGSPTNQIFVVLEKAQADRLSEKAALGFWENLDDGRVIMRIATSWATTDEEVEYLISIL